MKITLPASRGTFALTLRTVAMAASVALSPMALAKARLGNAAITEEQVNAAQQAWCDALLQIGKVNAEGGDDKAVAGKIIDGAYDNKDGWVLFKPTLTSGKNTFRNTRAGALSYFVGGNPDCPDDKGFALAPWVKVRYDNAGTGNNGIQIHDNIALSMGNVYLTGKDGTEMMVDKTFAFRKCADGKLRQVVHKSALPFEPAK